uniref:Putative ovule protein n=1 Tax=Solanum chacoense TaxID=4108 RepID=A0A0V0HXG0_SOLCH
MNLKLWIKAAIFKVCWDREHKADKLWIKWIHTYYIKGQLFVQAQEPQQASWMVRKLFESR